MSTPLNPITLTVEKMNQTINYGPGAVVQMRNALQAVADVAQDLYSIGEWVEAKIQQARFERQVHAQAVWSPEHQAAQDAITDQIDDLRTMAHMLKFANVADRAGTELAQRAMVDRAIES